MARRIQDYRDAMPHDQALVDIRQLTGSRIFVSPEEAKSLRQINVTAANPGLWLLPPILGCILWCLPPPGNGNPNSNQMHQCNDQEEADWQNYSMRLPEYLQRLIDEFEKKERNLNEYNADRNRLDEDNNVQLDREHDAKQERGREDRKRRQRRRSDDDTPVKLEGRVYAILDSLDPKDDGDGYVAVFDGFFDLGLTDPEVSAFASFGVANIFSVLITVDVNEGDLDAADAGAWHVLDVDFTNLSGPASIEFFITTPQLEKNDDVGRLGLITTRIYETNIGVLSMSRQNKALEAALNAVFEFDDVKIIPSSSAIEKSTTEIPVDAGSCAIIQNVGQGAFNTFSRPGQPRSILGIDVGFGNGNLTPEALQRLQQLAFGPQQPALTSIVISHWHKDHYRGLVDVTRLQRDCAIIGPTYGLEGGPTLKNLIRAIAS
jgi:hypothetical protein